MYARRISHQCWSNKVISNVESIPTNSPWLVFQGQFMGSNRGCSTVIIRQSCDVYMIKACMVKEQVVQGSNSSNQIQVFKRTCQIKRIDFLRKGHQYWRDIFFTSMPEIDRSFMHIFIEVLIHQFVPRHWGLLKSAIWVKLDQNFK